MNTLPQSSLTSRVADEIRKGILGREFMPGERLPGVRELAKQFGACKHTISTALEVLAQDGLIEKRQGRGVTVASGSKKLRVGILSELDLFDQRIGNCHRAVATRLRTKLAEYGADSQLYMGHAEPAAVESDEPTCPQFWTDIEAGRLDGAILLNLPSTQAWRNRVHNCLITAVGYRTGFEINIDFSKIARTAVRRLSQNGCKRLGLMSPLDKGAFLAAVAEFRLESCPAWIKSDLHPSLGGAGWKGFHEIWSAAEGRPDGLVILDDMLFADAQLAIMEMGVRIPQDLQIALLANRNASPLIRLPVNIFELDPEDVAEHFASMLIRRLRKELLVPTSTLLPFREIPAEIGEIKKDHGPKRARINRKKTATKT